jgi:hypothetical protein
MSGIGLYDMYETDPKVENDGVVLDYGLNKKGEPMELRVRRAGGANSAFAKVFEQKSKPYRRLIQADKLDRETGDRIMRETYAETIVIGWKGVQDRDGNDLPFTKENVIKVFTDLPAFFRDVVQQAQNEALFRAAVREADSGN